MKKPLILFAIIAFSSSVFAVEFFFNKSVGYWSVVGHPGSTDPKLNPACITATNWDDGSYLNIIQDLTDGELLIELKSNDWNVIDVDLNEIYDMTLNVYTSGNRNVKSWPTKFKFLAKNIIQIRGLNSDKFMPAFMNYDRMVFIMPGTIQNAEIRLQNSANAIALMTECIEAAKTKNPTNNTDDGPIQQGI